MKDIDTNLMTIAKRVVDGLMRNVDGINGDEFWLYKRINRNGFVDYQHLGSATRTTLIHAVYEELIAVGTIETKVK